MEDQEQVVVGTEDNSTNPEATATEAAEPQSPQNDLPPDMQQAFAKRLGAEKAKLEREIRAQLEAELTAKTPEPAPAPMVDDAEELAKINEELLNQFYDNPLEAMARAQEILAERQATRQKAEQARWSYSAAQLQRKYPDWQAVAPKMKELLAEQPDLAERPEHLERVYQIARKMAQTDPAVLLKDPKFLDQAKSVLRDQIVNEYVNGKRDQQQKAPPVMGNTPGGSGLTAPPSTPHTWEEARRAALARMGG